MKTRMRNTRKVAAAVLLIEMERIRRLERRRKKRKCWVRKWIERRALGLGALNMLLTELRLEPIVLLLFKWNFHPICCNI